MTSEREIEIRKFIGVLKESCEYGAAAVITELLDDIKILKKERDAAVSDLYLHATYPGTCKHSKTCKIYEKHNFSCGGCKLWEWRTSEEKSNG